MTKHEIGATIVLCIFVGLMGWVWVSFFPLTWGQALILSGFQGLTGWMCRKFIDELN